MEQYIFWWTFLLIIILWIGFLAFAKRKRIGLWKGKIEFYKKEIKKSYYLSASEKILNYDKILNHVLKDYWYEWNVWDQLKAKPSVIWNLDEVWKLHKIRNQIAHELWQMSEVKLIHDAKRFETILSNLLK